MSADTPEFHGYVNQNGSFVLIARAIGADGALVTQATVSTAKIEVTEIDEDGAVVATRLDNSALTVSSVIFDTAQTDATLWPNPPHADGYNFLTTVAPTAVPTAKARYQVDVKLVMTNGDVVILGPWEFRTNTAYID